MVGEQSREGWMDRMGEKGKKNKREEMKIHGNGLRREEGREKRVCVCVVWCKPWVLVDGWI